MNTLHKLLNNQIVIGTLSILLFWYSLFFLVNTHSIPSPFETIAHLFTIKIPILLHSLASLMRVLVALGISLIIGVPIGLFLGVNKTFNRVFSPFLYYLYPLPKVAFLPVFMLLFGLGNISKVMLIIWIIIFQIILSVRDGVTQIPSSYFKVMDSFAASTRHYYQYLVVPAVLPQLISGIRISIGISLASLFFAENYATTYGIGYFIISGWTKMNYIEMFGGILVLGLIGLLIFKCLDWLEARLIPWAQK
ncbi:ABC transporter permease [Bacillus sp. PS06]|uniref:ABC transporter permease n=1 Tax=Bacillus sp. PS06 TaxID=2764176 RepID=UPI0017822796|nr:ABC transporter permease subunit [Bacillus sp. PS06]MBD8069092.1 ABC transporter permease subunit [Bacillus sp. PS06]